MKIRKAIVAMVGMILSAGANAGTYGGGSGTPGDPYQISSTAHWTSLIASPGDWGKNFVLTANLDFGGANFNPVGNGTTFFTGVMDGAGHTLSNFRVRVGQVLIDNVGLFGVVSGGQIKNLGVVNATVRGSSYVGALVGDNNGTITSCYATGSVSGTNSVGGLAGYNSGTITACYATAAVSGTQVGGLVGVNFSTINSCYSTGAVSGTSPVGGLVGVNYSSVVSCFWDTQASGKDMSAGGTGTTTAAMKTLGTFTAAGWDFDYAWWMPAGGYPRLMWELGYGFLFVTIEPSEARADGAQWRRVGSSEWLNNGQIEAFVPAHLWYVEFKPTVHWRQPEPIQVAVSANEFAQLTATYTQLYSGGSGTDVDPYRIGSVADWLVLTARPGDWGKNFVLTADLDFGGAGLNPVGNGTPSFNGVMDGAGHTLSNLKIDQSSSGAGLFVYVGSDGQVKNLGVVNATIRGQLYVGGLAGINGGSITSCYATGIITGDITVGGLVGENEGGTITSCYATGTVSGNELVGGLVGLNGGGTITSCYATGTVNRTSSVGGLVGWTSSNTISDCYWDTQTSGQTTSAGGTGKTTAEMKRQSTFVGWDFATTWSIREGVTYPRLQWQRLLGDIAGLRGVNFDDFALISQWWGHADCGSMNNHCAGADINGNGKVDLADFALFAGQWMR